MKKVIIVHLNLGKSSYCNYLKCLPREGELIWFNDRCFEVEKIVYGWTVPHIFVKDVSHSDEAKYSLREPIDKLRDWTKEKND